MIFGGTRKHRSDNPRLNGISLRWFVVPAAIWLIAAILSIGRPEGLRFEQYLFLTQDAPVATLLLVCLALLPWPRVGAKPGSSFPPKAHVRRESSDFIQDFRGLRKTEERTDEKTHQKLTALG